MPSARPARPISNRRWRKAGSSYPTAYDDGAYSGGDLDRPALQKLLKDIDAGLVDVIVVYKIDRLTRSLADFAKLVEIFDAKKISFVAITQQFNTTTSMGRLTLNILLSFAQFERELSSERVRDKIAASRKKGKWTGGSVPLGYDTRDKKLVVNQKEAGTVRMIFNRYLALRSFQKVIDELNEKGIVSKVREAKGRKLGGVPFTYGPLAYLLKNRTYLGEMGHKGAWFPGEHKAIIDQRTFEQVQDLLKSNCRRPNRQAASEWRPAHRPSLRRQRKSDEPELHRQAWRPLLLLCQLGFVKGPKIPSGIQNSDLFRRCRRRRGASFARTPSRTCRPIPSRYPGGGQSERSAKSCSAMRTSKSRYGPKQERCCRKFVFHGRPHPARRLRSMSRHALKSAKPAIPPSTRSSTLVGETAGGGSASERGIAWKVRGPAPQGHPQWHQISVSRSHYYEGASPG